MDNYIDVFLTWRDGNSEWIARFQYLSDAQNFIKRYKWSDRFTSTPDEFSPILMLYDHKEPYAEGNRIGYF